MEYSIGGAYGGHHRGLWPERFKALVAVSGYGINDLKVNLQPPAPAAEYGWWYQYYFATQRGVLGYGENRHDFIKLIWKAVSPKWDFDDATYERTAASFNNPHRTTAAGRRAGRDRSAGETSITLGRSRERAAGIAALPSRNRCTR